LVSQPPRTYVDVGAGVGVNVGAGVGLHVQKLALCCRSRAYNIPLVQAQIGLSPGAHVDQYRRCPSAVPAQM
jgi:hypothetical protein